MRNPNSSRIKDVARRIAEQLEATTGCKVALGGSLASDTMVSGHQDIDLKLLAPSSLDDEAGVRAMSAAIAPSYPFQKERPYGGDGEQEAYAVVHQLVLQDNQLGEITVEILIVPARVYVGYARFMGHLPKWILDAFVAEKAAALAAGDEPRYKRVKRELYKITRDLYHRGYFEGIDATVW